MEGETEIINNEFSDFCAENVNNYCRLCLNVTKKLYQLFSSEETDALAINISMKVSLCVSFSISKHDELPQKICQKCLNYVNEWYCFRRKARKINLFLKKRLSSLEVKSENLKEGVIPHENSIGCTQDSNMEDALKLTLAMNSSVSDDGESIKNHRNIIKSTQSQAVNRKKKFKCSVCPDSFYYKKDLKSHKILIHNHIKLVSPQKVLPFTDPDVKLEGINMRTRYEMKCCGKVFFSKLKFRKHYNEKHPGEKPYMCETCGKKDFISEETLKRHKILHSGKFRCDVCQKTFTCNAILMLHKRDKHDNDKPFICDVCGKRFVTELLMNYHKRFHTGEKKYVCEECGLAVVTSSSLAKHKRIHSQEKPHICHVCGKGFIIKGRLVEHLRVHSGERPYSCQICQKAFTIKDKLKRHMRIHSGEKLFSCEYCGNSYSTKYGLLGHLKTHLEKSP